MIVSFVDIGTNSIKYIFCEMPGKRVLLKGLIPNRIGKGLQDTRLFSEEALILCVNNLLQICQISKDNKVSQIKAYGTKAFRTAHNTDWFISAIKAGTGIDITVLTGEEEAWFSYLGGTADFKSDSHDQIVLDIGGGSTELVIAREGRIISKNSYTLGAVFLKEKFCVISDPRLLEDEINQYISSILGYEKSSNTSQMICVGGTATTLAVLEENLEGYNSDQVHGLRITTEEVEKIKDQILALHPDRFSQLRGVLPDRQDIILYGLFILLNILKNKELKEIIISDKGLLYGLIEETASLLEL